MKQQRSKHCLFYSQLKLHELWATILFVGIGHTESHSVGAKCATVITRLVELSMDPLTTTFVQKDPPKYLVSVKKGSKSKNAFHCILLPTCNFMDYPKQ